MGRSKMIGYPLILRGWMDWRNSKWLFNFKLRQLVCDGEKVDGRRSKRVYTSNMSIGWGGWWWC